MVYKIVLFELIQLNIHLLGIFTNRSIYYFIFCLYVTIISINLYTVSIVCVCFINELPVARVHKLKFGSLSLSFMLDESKPE